MKIESFQNSKVKEWKKLKEKKFRDETNCFLIEGEHLLKEAEKYHLVKEKIVIDDISSEKNTYVVSKEIMKNISSQVTPPKVMAVCYKKEEKQMGKNILILDRIQDPGNLGTMIRSAVAFSYDTIVISNDSVDLYNEKVIRSTEGMLFSINVIRSDLEKIFLNLKNDDYKIYGTNVVDGQNIKDVVFAEKKAIVIGNEGIGMNTKWQKYIDEMLYIPMHKNCESLNAAISASIIMYESRN